MRSRLLCLNIVSMKKGNNPLKSSNPETAKTAEQLQAEG